MVEATLKGILYSVVKVQTLTSGYGVEGIRDIHGQIATAPARHTTIPAFAGMPPPPWWGEFTGWPDVVSLHSTRRQAQALERGARRAAANVRHDRQIE